jgi:hypothetical protein
MQRWKFLVLVTVAAAFAPSVLGQTTPGSVPDFSGVWRHPSLPGFEPLSKGPRPVTNSKRRASDGASDWNMLVGDHSNPILKPQAAAAVKKYGEVSLSGVVPPTPATQCWPMPVPYIFGSFNMQMVQQKDKVTLLYGNPDHEIRRVRLNQQHPKVVTPSWYGDSVGRYEGDTLVIDTVGVRTDRPYAMLDAYGTPYTKSLHIVERYRLLDYDAAKEGLERDRKENFRLAQGDIDRDYRGKYLQLEFTIEDEGSFTTPWSATITYGRGSDAWDEQVCAENPVEQFSNKEFDVPKAARPDF